MTLCVAFWLPLAAAAQAPAKADCVPPVLPAGEAGARTAGVAQQLGKINPCDYGISAKSLRSVWGTLLANKRTGGRRLDTAVPDGLPSGLMSAEAHRIRFDFAAVAAEQPRSFSLTVDKRPLLSMGAPPPQLSVPVERYDSNSSFAWVLTTASGNYHGEFSLLDESQQADVSAQLARLEQAALDPVSKLVYKAAIYDDADLYADRDRTFAEIRRMVAL